MMYEMALNTFGKEAASDEVFRWYRRPGVCRQFGKAVGLGGFFLPVPVEFS